MKIGPNTNFDIFPQKQHMKAYFPNFSYLLHVWGVSHVIVLEGRYSTIRGKASRLRSSATSYLFQPVRVS